MLPLERLFTTNKSQVKVNVIVYLITCSLYYHVNIMIDKYIYMWSKRIDNVLTQLINLVVLTDVIAQYIEFLGAIKTFGIS